MNFIDFRRRLAKDTEFRTKFENCDTLDLLIETAANEGYIFTAEEVGKSTDLLPEELENVVGGLSAKRAFSSGPKIIQK